MENFKFAIDISNVKKYDELSQIVEQLMVLRKNKICDTMNRRVKMKLSLFGGRHDIYSKTQTII